MLSLVGLEKERLIPVLRYVFATSAWHDSHRFGSTYPACAASAFFGAVFLCHTHPAPPAASPATHISATSVFESIASGPLLPFFLMRDGQSVKRKTSSASGERTNPPGFRPVNPCSGLRWSLQMRCVICSTNCVCEDTMFRSGYLGFVGQ